MANPDVLDVPNPGGLTTGKMLALQLEEYNRQVEAKRRCLEENKVAREGTSGTWPHDDDDDELLGTTIGTLRKKSKIAVEARR